MPGKIEGHKSVVHLPVRPVPLQPLVPDGDVAQIVCVYFRKSQSERFIETARQLECDEDKERFEEKLGKIAKVKPKPQPKARK